MSNRNHQKRNRNKQFDLPKEFQELSDLQLEAIAKALSLGKQENGVSTISEEKLVSDLDVCINECIKAQAGWTIWQLVFSGLMLLDVVDGKIKLKPVNISEEDAWKILKKV